MEYDAGGLFNLNSSLTSLAHELKSPLVLIRQLALSLGDDNFTERDLKTISHQLNLTSDRALRLVSDLTKVARLEDAMFQLDPINPRVICDEVLFSMSSIYKLHSRHLDVKYPRGSTLIIANQDLLRSVIYNFCDNALRYSFENSPSRLFIQFVSARKLRIGVRDYGPCLPPHIWREIKKSGAIHQPQPIQARPQSSGLGLYIISKFIHAMNGKLGVVHHRDGITMYADFTTSNQLSLL